MFIVSRASQLDDRRELTAVYNTGKMGLVSCSGSMCLGHESSGIVVQLGQNVAAQAAQADQRAAKLAESSGDKGKTQNVVGNAALHLGDRVTLEPGTTCRMCTDCRNGRYQVGVSRFDWCTRVRC